MREDYFTLEQIQLSRYRGPLHTVALMTVGDSADESNSRELRVDGETQPAESTQRRGERGTQSSSCIIIT